MCRLARYAAPALLFAHLLLGIALTRGLGLARERMANAGETLKSMMLESERVAFEEVSTCDGHRVPQVINGLSELISALDPNPLKGFSNDRHFREAVTHMKALPEATARRYGLGFALWVRDNVQDGQLLSLCMQCGVCSGSCSISVQMDYGPRKPFMVIRAGMKQEVLRSNTLWNCTSCYRCLVHCPRGAPVTYILQDLAAAKSAELGYAPKEH